MNVLLELDELSFAHPGAAALFEHLHGAIEAGSIVVVRGPSGSGKSTLLRLICRLEEPTTGTIRLNGRDITSLPPPLLRRRIAYIQQTPAVAAGTVRDNLLLPFSFKANRDLIPPEDAALCERLAGVSLSVSLDQAAETLSVGQKQRLCLIRAMLLTPEVMLLDEPTSALDPESAEQVVAAVEDLNRDGLTVVMVTHGTAEPRSGAIKNLYLADGRATWS